MIKGMTGFGTKEVAVGKLRALVEIKTLNHRYFDVTFYLPGGFAAFEDRLRSLLQKHIERGRITVNFKIIEKPTIAVSLNKDIVRQHLKFIHQLEREFGFENDLTLSDVVKLPGVVEAKETFIDPDAIWPAFRRSIDQALNDLVRMRLREGKSLAADINVLLRRMQQRIQKIQGRYGHILREKQKILTHDEIVSFRKSNDVSEELMRLRHYVEEMKILLKSSAAIGKKIDFIAQEMQRETNTIGSKLQDKIVSNQVIALKGKVEKIREQAQNVE
ncbi:MAG: YicC/YloC family endoribonuclease [Candidatus Omnitrophota bacterium]|jgi:uncharacterized protein (TIGR00255 family)|nr:YicC/YloC family endoribonuclease [Candidatus Omnitrophota bacterium]